MNKDKMSFIKYYVITTIMVFFIFAANYGWSMYASANKHRDKFLVAYLNDVHINSKTIMYYERLLQSNGINPEHSTAPIAIAQNIKAAKLYEERGSDYKGFTEEYKAAIATNKEYNPVYAAIEEGSLSKMFLMYVIMPLYLFPIIYVLVFNIARIWPRKKLTYTGSS